MRWLLLAATLFGGAGCLSIDTPDGTLRCADTDMHPGRACPQGFYCAEDSRCYRNVQPSTDMSRMGCATVLSCELACSTPLCSNSCLANANAKAVTLWHPVIGCAVNYCGAATQTDCSASSSCWMCVQSVLQMGLAGTGPCWSQIAPCLAVGNQ